jgi:hypothetical protein
MRNLPGESAMHPRLGSNGHFCGSAVPSPCPFYGKVEIVMVSGEA